PRPPGPSARERAGCPPAPPAPPAPAPPSRCSRGREAIRCWCARGRSGRRRSTPSSGATTASCAPGSTCRPRRSAPPRRPGEASPPPASALATFERRRGLLPAPADALAHVLAVGRERLAEGLLGEERVHVGLQRAVEQALRETDGERRPVSEPPRPGSQRRLQLRRRHHLVHEAEPFGVGR